MNLLLIDTSTKNFSLAVSRGNRVIRCRNVRLDKILSASIVPEIERILSRAGLSLEDLDAFGVGLGPGSFTSLRVGLSTVKALAFASGKPVVGVPSLDLIALNAAAPAGARVCVLMDARRDQVYAGLYQNRSGRIEKQSPYLLTGVDDLLARIEGPAPVIFTGDGAGLYAPQIHKRFASHPGPSITFAPGSRWFPQARKMLPLVLERITQKAYDDADRLVPLYLYPEDCQVRR